MKIKPRNQPVRREQFGDGSTLVTYPDGSVVILESDLAKLAVMRAGRPVNYNDAPPPPADEMLASKVEPLKQGSRVSAPGKVGQD